jgi:hypothetical protein
MIRVDDEEEESSLQVITLVGDSILHNDRYVRGDGRSVTVQLWRKIQHRRLDWKVHLCARDGATIGHVLDVQRGTVPIETTVMIVSAGGNDGLRFLHDNLTRMFNPCSWPFLLMEFRHQFSEGYERMVRTLVEDSCERWNIVLCTIYAPRWSSWRIFNACACGALLWMNAIIRATAAKYHLGVIDVYEIFDSDADYANPIEPSVTGGDKLTQNILRAVQDVDEGIDGGALFSHTYVWKDTRPEETEVEVEDEALRLSQQFTGTPWDDALLNVQRFREM